MEFIIQDPDGKRFNLTRAVSKTFLRGGMKLPGFFPIKRRAIPYGGWLCSGLVLGWLCFPGWGWCEPPPSSAPQPESLVSPPPAFVKAPTPSKRAEEILWRPLREVIQQYSETTGNPVRIGGALQQDDKLFNQVYSANDPSWLEDFNRIEIFNEQTGKKEIILINRRPGSPSGSSLNTRTTRKQSRKNRFRKKVSKRIQQALTKQKALTEQKALTKQNAKSKSPNPAGQRNKNKKKSSPPKHR